MVIYKHITEYSRYSLVPHHYGLNGPLLSYKLLHIHFTSFTQLLSCTPSNPLLCTFHLKKKLSKVTHRWPESTFSEYNLAFLTEMKIWLHFDQTISIPLQPERLNCPYGLSIKLLTVYNRGKRKITYTLINTE